MFISSLFCADAMLYSKKKNCAVSPTFSYINFKKLAYLHEYSGVINVQRQRAGYPLSRLSKHLNS